MTTWKIVDDSADRGVEPVRFGWDGRTVGLEAGLLVQFESAAVGRWVGEFAMGDWTGHRSVVPFIDGRRLVVLAEGIAYLVDPDRKQLDRVLAEFAVAGYCLNDAALFVINWDEILFEAFDQRAELRWRTRRISWVGVERVSWSSSVLSADTWSAPEERWVPVQVDLLTGRATGGGYDFPDREGDEILHNAK